MIQRLTALFSAWFYSLSRPFFIFLHVVPDHRTPANQSALSWQVSGRVRIASFSANLAHVGSYLASTWPYVGTKLAQD